MSDKTIDLGDDDGFAEVTFGGATVRIDLFEARAKLAAHHEASKAKPLAEYDATLLEVVASFGLPSMSRRQAHRFASAVYAACEEQKKSTEGPAELPGSTGSIPAGLILGR